MNREYIEDEEQFKEFCSQYRVGRYIENPPKEYPCIILWIEIMGWYEYEFVYLSDF